MKRQLTAACIALMGLTAGAMGQELAQNKRTKKSSEQSPVVKVKPGDVRWHANFDKAKAAATKSGKPVLLFQLLGKLDEQFT